MAIGARLALLALAFQLGLSAVHNHALGSELRIVAQAESSDNSQTPAAPATHEDCAVCASIAAFSGLDLPSQPAIPLPVRLLLASHVTGTLFGKGVEPLRQYRPRAPPAP